MSWVKIDSTASDIATSAPTCGIDDKCIRYSTVQNLSQKGDVSHVEVKEDGTYVEVCKDGCEHKLVPVSVSLHDCLGCNGCATTEGDDFVQKRTSPNAFWDLLTTENPSTITIVSIAPQARASIASSRGWSHEELMGRLLTFFRSRGVQALVDTGLANDLLLDLALKEFQSRLASGSLPVLVSACPGLVEYAEKTNRTLLPHLSALPSPQQLMGVLVKQIFARNIAQEIGEDIESLTIRHLSIAPCVDLRDEAIRYRRLSINDTDVDAVITSREFETLLKDRGIDLSSLDITPLSDQSPMYLRLESNKFASPPPGPSGGYANHILSSFSPVSPVQWDVSRSGNMRETTIKVPNSDKKLKIVTAYGFRQVQAIARKLKSNDHDGLSYVEVMACPGGCTNGGGQIEVQDQEVLSHVEAVYRSGPEAGEECHERRKELMKELTALGEDFSTVERDQKPEAVESKGGCRCRTRLTAIKST